MSEWRQGAPRVLGVPAEFRESTRGGRAVLAPPVTFCSLLAAHVSVVLAAAIVDDGAG